MPQETPPPTPDAPDPTGTAPDHGTGADTNAAATATQEAPAGQTDDAVYDAAFSKFMGPDASEPDGSEADTPAGSPTADGAGDPEPGTTGDGDQDGGSPADPASTPTLTDDQTQLLKRLHMSPEMVAGWSPEQRATFFQNAAKREGDQTTTFKTLQAELKELRDKIDAKNQGGGDADAGDNATDKNAKPQGSPPADTFEALATSAVDDAVDVYGEEMRGFGDVVVRIGKSADQLAAQVEAVTQEKAQMGGLVVDMVIDSGIRDLVSDFPSLSKPEVRAKVRDRFKDDWAKSNHREGDGSLLDRVRAALGDAAKGLLGTTTESAAQVALVNTTKERLKNQPQAGAGKGRKANPTEDDIYDAAFEEHLKPDSV